MLLFPTFKKKQRQKGIISRYVDRKVGVLLQLLYIYFIFVLELISTIINKNMQPLYIIICVNLEYKT
jgi:hypothetical protein